MKISKQARRDAKDLFRATQVDGLLDENRARQVVDAVLSGKPRGYLSILSHFQRLVKLDTDRRTARVESFTNLDEREQAELKAALTRRYGKGLYFQFSQNPAMIGGMRVQVGSDVFDGSIRARLETLKNTFEIA
jgi:F-type H+-transporting ATPase subunit delta